MNPVVHFEIPGDDKKRMAKFYGQAFGWQTEFMGPDMQDYVVATTTPLAKNGRPAQPGAINGGFYQRTDDPKLQHMSVVISVDDIDEAIKKVTAAGGKVDGKPTDIPGVGKYVSFLDTEGNRLSMLQPSPNM